jgi:hypothetical protein
VNSKKLLCVTCLILLVLGFAATLWAQSAVYNRPNPTMDYVPQELGLYDGMYADQTESTCRKCHGNSTVDRHHGLPMVVRDHLCLPCHPTCTIGDPNCPNGITIIRNCLTVGCHSASDVQFGNGAWHHNTDMANSENCIACHNQELIEEITPFRSHELYPPSVVSPTPFSCENCHWEQALVQGTHIPRPGDAPGHPSTYDHVDAWGNCIGFFEYGKPISNNIDTHHMNFVGNVSSECYKCHSQDPGNPSWDPYNPELMRFCEICHSIASLHNIGPHVSEHPGWDPTGFHAGGGGPNPTLYHTWDFNPCGKDGKCSVTTATACNVNADCPGSETCVLTFPYIPQDKPGYTADQQCFGCHGDDVPAWVDPSPNDDPPVIVTNIDGGLIAPPAGSCGVIGIIRGLYFGSEHIDGRDVMIAPKTGPGNTCDWTLQTELPIHAWNDTYIEWELPCWDYAPGNYCVRVHTEDGNSNRAIFTVMDTPTLLAVTPDVGTCADWLTITGSGGFGNVRNKMFDSYYGVTHIVDFVASNGEFTATRFANWTDTSIQVRVYDWFRDLGGIGVEDQPDTCSINPTTGQPRMERNFVQDIGDENADTLIQCDNAAPAYDECKAEPLIPRCDCLTLGTFNVYVKSIYFGDDDASGGLSCGDTIFEVEKSDAGQFTLTNTPFIFKLNPRQVVDQNAAPYSVLKIYGGNFGPSQLAGDSVRIGTKADFLNPILGLGRELTKVVLWSDTLIKVRVTVPNAWRGKTRYVWIERAGEKSDEVMKLFILAP